MANKDIEDWNFANGSLDRGDGFCDAAVEMPTAKCLGP